MTNFASGFSKRLNIEATKHRPPSTTLSYNQIVALSALAGYRIVSDKSKYAANFIIFHPDAEHGLDNGLHVIWHARTDGWNLIYYPTLQSFYIRGNKHKILYEMLDRLAKFLPDLGYQKEIVIPLEEEAITLPLELQKDGDVIFIMFKSEFQKKYQSLYAFLKEKMTPDR